MHTIAFAAPILIRTDSEKEIVLETINALSSYQLPVILVDGGSSREHKQALQQHKNVFLYDEQGGLTKQIITSHKQAAMQADYIFYIQSDKLNFARDVVPQMLHRYESLDTKGLLIPSRTHESMQTYPSFQRTQETFLNFFMSDYIGIQQDFFAGPKIFPKELVPYLDAIKGDIGWGIESYYYVLAKRLGLPFDFLSCFITSPQDVEEEEKTKHYRLLGTKWQIEGLFMAHDLSI